MSDLISRKEAIDSIESHLRVVDELYPLTRTDEILNYAFEVAASCVYNLPSAEVTLCHLGSPCEYQNADIALPSAQPERKKGQWIYNESDDMFECSVCGGEMIRNVFTYCPWCGERMVRGDEMTSKEAAEYILDHFIGDDTKWDKAMFLAYCALQKQIPKKALQACGHATERWMNYCPICGQRIDWE